MSDNKKYYYLKLKENFFDSDDMIVLESMQDGVIYSNILLKLYLRSLKYDGRLMFNERIPFNSTMLSQVTRQSVGDIEKAVKLFEELGLIEIMDNGAIYMTEIQNFIGRSSTEADRKREFRAKIDSEKRAITTDGQMSGQMSDKNPPEKEIEKEIELEKEIQLQQEDGGGSGVIESFATFQQLYTFPNMVQQEDLKDLIDKYSDELVNASLKVAGTNDVLKGRVINFISAVLSEWNDANVKTLDQAREYTKKRQRAAKGNKSVKPIRQEIEPSWSTEPKKEYGEETEVKLSPEIEARFQKYLERKEQENAEQDDITR